MHKYLTLILCFSSIIHSFPLHRVILATDANENYIQFWPIVAKAWKEIVGLQPTLALIGDETVEIDETLGEVIRFAPIEGVSTALYAQAVRHLLPVMFPNEGCIISDIDMIPLSKDYFGKSVESFSDDTFVVYRDRMYPPNAYQYPMCYCAAYGKVFKDIFHINTPEEIPSIIKQWSELNLGWSTDELLLYRYLNVWNKNSIYCVKLGHGMEMSYRRIDRLRWGYNKNLLQSGHYIDMHCPRPYNEHKAEINMIMQLAFNASRLNSKSA
jgi:hypothetical protein